MLILKAQESIHEITLEEDDDGYLLVSQQHDEDYPYPIILMDRPRAIALAKFILENFGAPESNPHGSVSYCGVN